MRPQLLHIAGQAPSIIWKLNIGRKRRTIDEAFELATTHDVQIADDVVFIKAEPGDLKGTLSDLLRGARMETAKGPWIEEHADGFVYWSDHYNKAGKIPFRVHPEILTTDEGIVAVYAHEIFELERFREVFMSSRRKRMNATDYGIQSSPGYKGNFHDLAWDAADQAVLRMRANKQ